MLPPNPSLVAIILIIKTNTGPRQVLAYPPEPGKDNSHIKLDYEDSSKEDSTSSEDDSSDGQSSLEDGRTNDNRSSKWGDQKAYAYPDLDESGSVSPEKIDGGMWRRPGAEDTGFLGLPIGLQHFLCPPVTSHKKKFEISIDGLVFLGWPVFAREYGEWQKKKKGKLKDRQMTRVEKHIRTSKENDDRLRPTSVEMDDELDETSGQDTTAEDQESTIQNTAAAALNDIRTQVEVNKHHEQATRLDGKEILTMFHVVFVLDPPPLEHQIRIADIYRHVVKKFSRALKWEQTRSDYVLKEATKMRELEARGGKLCLNSIFSSKYHVLTALDTSVQQKIKHSSLAKAIATLYTSISTSRIAHITLTPTLSLSLQIPIPTSISALPTPTSPQLPGLWLTTATSIIGDDEVHPSSSQLASHFALLLLSDLPAILADVTTTASPLTGPLTHYLRVSKPTKSFVQISQSSGIPLTDIQFLASHLIYWRRARAVPPLHQRDAYIVSPNADMRKLRSACTTYARLFPTLPSLPKMLSLLSATPRPYLTLIPSKDHKEAYLDILAWLMRGGWVTQLRTFAWVRVTAEIQTVVAREIEKEKREESAAGSDPKDSHDHEHDTDDISSTDHHRSGHLSPPRSLLSTSSTSTAIPLPSTTNSPPLFILNPTRASGLESRYLSAISAQMQAEHGAEVREAWERCWKYVNGQHALEKISVREGWKRKWVGELLGVWRGMGVLEEVRHW